MLVTGSKETARLWGLSAADPAASARVLRGHNGIILKMVVRPDKTTLVTVSNDGTARVWNLRVEALQKLATLVAGRDLSDEEREQYRRPASKDSSYGEFGAVELLAWEYPQFPRPTDAAWHERQATECELIGNAFGAVFHLERLLTFRPDDVEVQKRLAMAREDLRSAASKAENSFQIPGTPPIDIPEPRPNRVK